MPFVGLALVGEKSGYWSFGAQQLIHHRSVMINQERFRVLPISVHLRHWGQE
jgi:hypothetical protein